MNSGKVLIVDDSSIGRDSLEELLINQGYDLGFAENGFQALEMLEKFNPDIILLDVMMPGMDGFEVCRRVRESLTYAELPVVMVTALDDPDSLIKGIEAGADDFLTKPYNKTELRARIKSIMRLNRYRKISEQKKQLDWIIENDKDGYLIVNEEGKIEYLNKAAHLMLYLENKKPSFAAGRNFIEDAKVNHKLEPEENWTGFPVIDSEKFELSRYLIFPESRSSECIWIKVEVLTLFSGPGGKLFIRLVDVTQEITMTRDLRSFHGALRHKLRTPLTAMKAGIEVVNEFVSDKADEEMKSFSDMLVHGVNRLVDSVEDILSFLNVTSSHFYFGMSTLDTACEVMSITAKDLEIGSIEVNMNGLAPSNELFISRQALEMITREIFENSKKFHPQNSPSVRVCFETENNDKCRIQICDNGIFLSAKQLENAFSPYYQGEKYFTGEAKGLGLGLSTVAQIMWSLGGTCSIRNTSGPAGGVCVELVLPFKIQQL